MENKEAASSLYFGTDLCKQAKNHIEFLKAVDAVTELKDPAVLKRAVYRYEKYWLPLASDHQNTCLSAPVDVEWVWHCHLLSPVSYETDCQVVVGATVNHTFQSQDEFKNGQEESEIYWNEKYPDERESFHLDFSEEWDNQEIEQFNSRLSYDIVAAAKRQMDFVNKLTSPLYRNEKFLENSLQRYKQFIHLETKMPQLQLVPANDIDLMWHTHQSNPLVYKDDMVRITGTLVDHDDTDTDKTEGSTLYNAAEETKDTWNEFYNESLLLNLSTFIVNNEFGAGKSRNSEKSDTEMNEMGTCYNRGGIDQMGTCYSYCYVDKNLPDTTMNEMGTCYNSCSIHKNLPDTTMNEMLTCYNRGSVRKNLTINGNAIDNQLGTNRNEWSVKALVSKVINNQMGACFNGCSVRKLPSDHPGNCAVDVCKLGTCQITRPADSLPLACSTGSCFSK